MMEMLAPAILALLFIAFGLSRRGHSHEGCGSCAGDGVCRGKGDGDCKES